MTYSMYFEDAFHFVIMHEGGYVNDPDDPGGETNHGISKRAYPNLDIKNLTSEDAKRIYKDDYWLKIAGDWCAARIDSRFAIIAFDTAVNLGVDQTVKFIQRICCEQGFPVEVDGKMGPITRSVMLDCDPLPLAISLLTKRLAHYSILNKPKYFRGWVGRVTDLMEFAFC